MLLPLVIAGLVMSSLVFAGNKNSGERIERLAEKLELKEAQKTEFSAIMEQQHAKKKVIKDEIRELKKARFSEHREETRSALSQVLDADQLAKLDEMIQKRMEKRQGERRNHKKQ